MVLRGPTWDERSSSSTVRGQRYSPASRVDSERICAFASLPARLYEWHSRDHLDDRKLHSACRLEAGTGSV
jgi:hypothetical protein